MGALPYLQESYDFLTTTQKAAFDAEYKRKKRNIFVAYLLWIIGCHYLYLKKYRSWILFEITLGALGLWAILDFFRMPSIVKDANNDIYKDTLKDIQILVR